MDNCFYFFTISGSQLFAMPDKDRTRLGPGAKASFVLKGVKPAYISVDLNSNFGSQRPFFILGISLLQVKNWNRVCCSLFFSLSCS